MTRRHLVAVGLMALGLLSLFVAPLAQSCVTSGDSTVCETAGIVMLNLVGVALAAGGLLLFIAASTRARRRAG